MAVRQRPRIGIDPRIASGPLTGIGNYTLMLLQALVEDFPELDYRFYSRASWRPADAMTFAEIATRQGKGAIEDRNLSITTKARHHLTNRLSRNPIAKAVYDRLVTGAARRTFAHTVGEQNLQLFHAFNFVPLADPAVPVIPVVYDCSFVRYPHTHPADRLRRLASLPALLERAPFIHTISEFSKAEITALYKIDDSRIFVAPPAAGRIFCRQGAAATNGDLARYDLVNGQFFLAVGTLEPRKNLKTLIDAFSRLTPQQRQRHPLVVVGGMGWGDIDLPRASSAMQGDGSLRFVGSVSDGHLRSLYEGTRALLFPSIYEGFGMPVVEAFGCGAQAVHGKNTSMSEITGDLAIQVTAESSDDWLFAMRQLIDQTDAERATSQDMRINRASQFAWRESARTVRDIYRQLLND